MAQFYRCFIKNFAYVMGLITKLLRKAKMFKWTTKCKIAWEDIKNVSNVNCCDSFSALVMMFYSSTCVCSHGH